MDLEDIIDNANEAKSGIEGIGLAAQKAQQYLTDMAASAGESFGELTKQAVQSTGSIGNAFMAAALSVEPFFNILDKKRKVFGELGEDGKNAANLIKDSYGGLGNIFNTIGATIGGKLGVGIQRVNATIMTMAEQADKTKVLEANLLKTAAATGQLGDFLTSTGEDFGRLSDKTATYTELITSTAEATNRTTTSIGQYIDQLKIVPGALDANQIEIGGQMMNELTASIKLAAGTGMDYSDVVGGLSNSFKMFNLQGKDALEYVNRIAIASKTLQIPLDSVKKLTEEAARQFRFLGDNTGGAINVMGGFQSAMKNTGLGYETIQEIASGAIQSIQKMSIAQKAFLSQQTGGAGGFQGAFEIESKLREGKTDEVFGQVEESLRQQMGGTIVTLDQARSSQDAAAQMMRQIAFLTQGPTAITSDEGVATRIADALAKGQLAGLKDILASPQDRLADAVKVGTDFQKAQASELTKISNQLDKQLLVQSLTLREMEKQVTGSASAFTEGIIESMRTGAQKGTIIKPITGERGAGSKTYEDELTAAKDDFKGAVEGSGNMLLHMIDSINKKSAATEGSPGVMEKMLPGGMAMLREEVSAAKERLVGRSEMPAMMGPEMPKPVNMKEMMAGIAPPATMASEDMAKQLAAMASITKEGMGAGQSQAIELNINLTREGEELSKQTVQFLIDKSNTKIQQQNLDLAYVGHSTGQ